MISDVFKQVQNISLASDFMLMPMPKTTTSNASSSNTRAPFADLFQPKEEKEVRGAVSTAAAAAFIPP